MIQTAAGLVVIPAEPAGQGWSRAAFWEEGVINRGADSGGQLCCPPGGHRRTVVVDGGLPCRITPRNNFLLTCVISSLKLLSNLAKSWIELSSFNGMSLIYFKTWKLCLNLFSISIVFSLWSITCEKTALKIYLTNCRAHQYFRSKQRLQMRRHLKQSIDWGPLNTEHTVAAADLRLLLIIYFEIIPGCSFTK